MAKSNFIFVKSGKEILRVKYEDISFIESLGNYVKLHTTSGIHVTYQSMNDIIDKLPDGFSRVHNSYIINIEHLDKVVDQTIFIGDTKIPISKSFRDCFKNRIDKHLL